MPKSKINNTNFKKGSKNNFIEIKGAEIHNLKKINISIPRDKFIVMTGLSGSGKSSLAFDTLFAEGQRRYIESLSSYARQFLGRMKKPEVEYIKGIPPAIAIEQKVNTRNSRSTVGTSTEIYDYLKLLYARVGKTYSPKSGKIVKKHSVTDVINYLQQFPENTKAIILSPIFVPENREFKSHLKIIQQQGYTSIEVKNKTEIETISINNILQDKNKVKQSSKSKNQNNYSINLIIDRIKTSNNENAISRLGDSVQTAFYESSGVCIIKTITKDETIYKPFSNRFEADGILFEEPSVHTFTFNNPVGACRKCDGYGMVVGISENLIIPNKNLSIYQDAVYCWRGEKLQWYKNQVIINAEKIEFPIHKPYNQLTKEQKNILWEGTSFFVGINQFFQTLEKERHKIQNRVILSRYRGKTICPECNGTRLKKESFYIKIANRPIQDLVLMQISDLKKFFETLKLSEYEQKVAKRILIEINNRLDYLNKVGLGYLTLNRLSSTLSGGESQRINLSTSLGSSLVGSLYILDEPTIGLHPADTNKLLTVLKKLQEIGNSVIVVEHDEEIIRQADEIIDIGPLAGTHGGEIVFQGTNKDFKTAKNSLTAKYMSGEMQIEVPKIRRKISKQNGFIEIIGASENNLKNINVKFPLKVMTVVTGVSGSGKSSLVNDVLYPALQRKLELSSYSSEKHDTIKGNFNFIERIEFVNQNPIGKSSRSNPATYIGVYDDIRKLFAETHQSKINSFQPSHFSFNVDGGRCKECQGAGTITIEMQFMADVTLICETCKGKRFIDDILEVKYNAKNIYNILEMTVDDAIIFFNKNTRLDKKINKKLQVLSDVGLGYVNLGQASNTLSGGESQRIKLASFLTNNKKDKQSLFIFDEPTTGLHFHDIKKLLSAFNKLIDNGNSLIIIEHNLEIIKSADWLIDLGPGGGDAGGEVIFEGTPEALVKNKKSITGKYLGKLKV